ncbi:hypothetical protein LVY65_00215 [Sphingomonas sp. G124]|uniref:Uncharacterized protein n=1 Tax=Sphingomonas cremea TaxID=2904799 RepID=A0A9X1QHM9_9SPHN|nr:hypothetical protein [Sphingomonas cremea]MCF2513496.1 hypothetical protein [Sphingomonas cremea]
MSTPPFDWTEFEPEFDDPTKHIPFTPVPRLRARRRGWSEGRQRAFIFALSRCGSVARAARAVGMSPRSAYQLLYAPGADDFARAWDMAIDQGVARVRADALQRALGGAFVPVFRRGKLVRVEHRRSDALAIALLGGQDKVIDDYRRTAVSRRRYRQDMAELDRQREEEQRRKDQVWAEHQAILDRIELDRLLGRDRPQPRVRIL